jgi:thiol-disulfide isomerase/thioredoxin
MSSVLPPDSASEGSPKKVYRLMAMMAIALIFLLSVIIYSLSQISGTNAPKSADDLPIPTLQPTLRQDLPHFEYTDQGKSLTPQNFEGKWTLVSFWAYWCAPCLQEMPALNQLTQQWQGPEFEVLTVNVDKSENYEAAKKFLSDQGIALPTLFDKSGDLKRAFAVEELPQHFLINPQLKIVWRGKGAFQWTAPKTRDQLMKVMEDESQAEESTGEPDQDSPSESAE